VIDYARRLGIRSPLVRDLSLALGASDVSLVEITSAYAVYAHGGRRVVPRFIRRVTDREGRVLLQDVVLGEPPEPAAETLEEQLAEKRAPGPLAESSLAAEEGRSADDAFYPDVEELPPDQLVSPAAAYLMVDLLRAVVVDAGGTAWRLRKLERPVAGKTGTTNDQNDAWFVGFSPEIATGVWIGYDETKFLGVNETGGRSAAPIWVDYMRVALADRPVRDFVPPPGIVFQRIDRATGLLADSRTQDAYFQPFVEGTAPTDTTADEQVATERDRLLRLDSF
jgi:penicillin-binding protein 1A